MNLITDRWNKISRIGLNENEGVHNMRNVIFLNRLLTVILIVATLFVGIEMTIHGPKLMPLILVIFFLMLTPLVLHHYRKFKFASHFSFYALSIFIFNGGLMVGPEVNNNITLVPCLLVAVILFPTLLEKIWALVFIAALYIAQYHLFDIIEPRFHIPSHIMAIFRPIFYVLALIFTFFAGYYLTVINREYEDVIHDQKAHLEEKNKEITDSIKYAKRIQNAILPPLGEIREKLPNSFVLYKPKDIVAGDFYWLESFADSFAEASGSKEASDSEGILLAAADCTGHGVPGAMVSVVCNNSLNRSVREYGLTDPGKILDKTRELVVAEFEKSFHDHEDEVIKDGMDIALVRIEQERSSSVALARPSKLTYAGAHNPLWIIRKGSDQIEEIKANKEPIGKFSHPNPFKTHEISLHSGDRIYIFSDGFADQFGGEKGKKYKSANFKKFLLSIQKNPLLNHQDLLFEEFENWKGSIEQVDDVCIIGIEV